MDVLLRLPLPFMTDLLLANRACADLFPGWDSFSSLLPMDILHMLFIVISVALMLDTKTLSACYKFMLCVALYDVTFDAYFWIVKRYRESYFLELFLQLLIISIAVYPFRKPRSKLCMLVMALFLYLNFEENPRRLIRCVKYALFGLWVLVAGKDRQNEDDENMLVANLDMKWKRAVQTLSSFWIIVILCQPRSWFDSSEWNLWNGIFVDGMNTPTRVCAMSGFLLILTNYALDFSKMFVFGRNHSNSMSDATKVTVYFFASVLDDRVWDLELEKRAELVQIYLLIHLVLFLSSCYDLCVSPCFALNQNNVNRRAQKTRACVLCSLISIISIYTIYFACSTFTLTVRSCVLFILLSFLILKMSVQMSFNVGRQFQWFSDIYNVGHLRRAINVIFYVNNFCKELLLSLCLMWMSVFHAVKLLRVSKVMYFLFNDLVNARAGYRKYTQPKNCVRSLPRASAEQLAANDDVCLVCHEDMEEACVTPCSHYYHPRCLLKWLYVNNKCALCQTALY